MKLPTHSLSRFFDGCGRITADSSMIHFQAILGVGARQIQLIQAAVGRLLMLVGCIRR
jgi:hypothetical protein